MPVTKSKKIKDSATQSGLKNANDYVDDEMKTRILEDYYEKGDLLEELSRYAESGTKTINPNNMRHLVSVINCSSPKEFVNEGNRARTLYRKSKSEHLHKGHKANVAFHIIMSCKGRDTNPELIHNAGIDVARELCGNDFAAKICTHMNTDHYHNHIIINAFSNDGTHKFKDEYNFYKKLRKISDTISLEYGFDICRDGPTKDHKTIVDYLELDPANNIKSKNRQVKEDIMECAALSSSMEDYEKHVTERGYTLKHNKTSVVYEKEDYRVSDRRLGTKYTWQVLEEGIKKRLKNEEDRETIRKIRREPPEDDPEEFRPPLLFVPAYDKNGKRLSALVRLLTLIKKYIGYVGDRFYSAAAREALPDNIRLQTMTEKVGRIDTSIEICEKYGIASLSHLEDMLRQADRSQYACTLKAERLARTALKTAEAVDLMKREDALSASIRELGLNENNFYITPVNEEQAAKNLAALDPMEPSMKKRLYNALANSPYRMNKGSLSHITRTQAEEVLAFLKGNESPMPSILFTEEEYNRRLALEHTKARVSSRNGRWEKAYEGQTASEAQVKLLKKLLEGTEYAYIKPEELTKQEAMRLAGRLTSAPKILAKSSPPPEGNRPTKQSIHAIKDLKLTEPELDSLDETLLTRSQAQRLVSFYYGKYDTILEELAAKYKEPEKKPNYPSKGALAPVLKSCSPQAKKDIIDYQHLLSAKNRYGLDTEQKTHAFIKQYENLKEMASESIRQAHTHAETWDELHYVHRTLINAASGTFLFGLKYPEKYSKDVVKKLRGDLTERHPTDDTKLLITQIERTLPQLGEHPMSEKGMHALLFEPLPAHIRQLLTDTDRALSGALLGGKDGKSRATALCTYADAYAMLLSVKNSRVLEKRLRLLESIEKHQDWPSLKERDLLSLHREISEYIRASLTEDRELKEVPSKEEGQRLLDKMREYIPEGIEWPGKTCQGTAANAKEDGKPSPDSALPILREIYDSGMLIQAAARIRELEDEKKQGIKENIRRDHKEQRKTERENEEQHRTLKRRI